MAVPSISVIIPAHNAAALVPLTIRSVQAQTFSNWELVVIDDGSKDATADSVRPFLSDSRVRYVFQENQERSAARNNGISRSAGAFIAFLDADDLWHPQKLETQLALMESNPEMGMCYTYTAVMNSDGGNPRAFSQPMAREGWIFGNLVRGNFITVSSVMLRRSVVQEVGLFDPNPALLGSEDWDLWLRISRKFPVGVVRKYLTTYRSHLGAQSHSKIFQGALGVLNKHFADQEFVNSAGISRRRAFSFAYLSAAGFSATRLGRLQRLRLLSQAVRYDTTTLFTPPAAAAVARIVLPERFVSWLQQSQESYKPADMRS